MPKFEQVVDNPDTQRIELTVDGNTAFVAYELVGQSIVMTHTEVPDELQGQGVGSALARGALDLARSRNLEVVPLCPFITAYIRRHREYLGLVSEKNLQRFDLG